MSLKREITRKTFHIVSIAIPIGYMFLDKQITLSVIAAVFGISIILELARLFNERLRKFIHPIFEPIMRVGEQKKISGATYLLIGAWITIYFFDKNVAIAAIFLVSIGDAVAAIVGTAYGKAKIWDKTIEGTAAFFVTSGVIMFLMTGLTLEQKLAGMFAGTLTELLPIPINDNLTLPIITAVVVQYWAV